MIFLMEAHALKDNTYMNDIIKQTLTEKIDALTQSVWGVSNNELTEIVYKIDKLKQQLKLIK